MDDVLRGIDDVAAWVADRVWTPQPDAPRLGKVGLEAEFFPFWVTPGEQPSGRLALVELIAIIDEIPGAQRCDGPDDRRPSWRLAGAVITEEPGAQLEIAGPALPSADRAIADLEPIAATLQAAFEDAGAALVCCGLDPFSDEGGIPVQLAVPRYGAMDRYFRRRGDEHGHRLMCASASLQVNVDLGPPEVARDRWLAAHLAAPAIVAAFAASPSEAGVNTRSLEWRRLDSTRTGIPPRLVEGGDDPSDHVTSDLLRADVMMVRRDDEWSAGWPGWRFGDWVAGDDRGFGPPTVGDLEIHQTTLFPEHRARGFLEVRGIDALPAPWRAAATALTAGLLYDTDAVAAVLDRATPQRQRLPALLEQAARAGLADAEIAALTRDVLELALVGARRVAPEHAPQAEDFLDRFTRRGRHPADELGDALKAGTRAALAWARDGQ